VSAGLPSLRNDRVRTRVDGVERSRRASDRPQHDATRVVDAVGVRPAVAPGEREHVRAGLDAGLDLVGRVDDRRRLVEDEGDAERPVRALARFPDQLAGTVGVLPGDREHPERAGVRDRRREFGAGGRTDGRLDDRVLDAEQGTERRFDHARGSGGWSINPPPQIYLGHEYHPA